MNPLEILSSVDHAAYLEQLADMSAIRYDAGILEDLLRNVGTITSARVILTPEEIQDEVYKCLLSRLEKNTDQVDMHLHNSIVVSVLERPTKFQTTAGVATSVSLAIDYRREQEFIITRRTNESHHTTNGHSTDPLS